MSYSSLILQGALLISTALAQTFSNQGWNFGDSYGNPSSLSSSITNVLYTDEEDPWRKCPKPYVLIGMQCLFFSQPYDSWGLTQKWDNSYANYYDALATCRVKSEPNDAPDSMPGRGDLAERVLDFDSALKYCNGFANGGCAPSLISRNGSCFQWSPLDGSESEIPCRRWQTTMRFICEFHRFF